MNSTLCAVSQGSTGTPLDPNDDTNRIGTGLNSSNQLQNVFTFTGVNIIAEVVVTRPGSRVQLPEPSRCSAIIFVQGQIWAGSGVPDRKPEVYKPVFVPGRIRIKFICNSTNVFELLSEQSLNNIYSGVADNYTLPVRCLVMSLLQDIAKTQGPNLSIGFCLDESLMLSGGAIYDPTTESIKFNNETYMMEQTLIHELFHYYQHKNTYGVRFNSFGQYTNNGIVINSPGFVNIEFETHLFLSIMTRSTDGFIQRIRKSYPNLLELNAIEEQYSEYIKSFTDINLKLYPGDVTRALLYGSDYEKFLNIFATKSDHYRSEIIDTMKPETLAKLLLDASISECNQIGTRID
ncbi:hypothetical protein ACFSQ3_09625 [Sphingobacterium corticis]|uniref:Uncharacterized protein n=1 Tax=Sphingobacterium corticis TaxID=1812823 RepID=A0ABW5NJA8_9SPHI